MINNIFFSRHPKNVARILESSIPVGVPGHFRFFEDFYTIRNTTPMTESKENDDSDFIFSDKNMIRGYVDSKNSNIIDLSNPKIKIVKTLTASVYHFLIDDLSDIIFLLGLYPNAELILDVSNIKHNLDNNTWTFFPFFIKVLEDKKISYKLVELKKFDIVYINNFCSATTEVTHSNSLNHVYDFFKKYITNKKKPHKHVYVSRKKMPERDMREGAQRLSFQVDNRIDDHEKIEEIFKNLGYEIVYPEDFENFQDQINYFNTVKTLVSLTSSGIANCLFMQPGGTIIEVSTPLIVNSPLINLNQFGKLGEDINVVQELHTFYKMCAYMKNLSYFSINNSDRKSNSIKKTIYSDTSILNFIDKR